MYLNYSLHGKELSGQFLRSLCDNLVVTYCLNIIENLINLKMVLASHGLSINMHFRSHELPLIIIELKENLPQQRLVYP